MYLLVDETLPPSAVSFNEAELLHWGIVRVMQLLPQKSFCYFDVGNYNAAHELDEKEMNTDDFGLLSEPKRWGVNNADSRVRRMVILDKYGRLVIVNKVDGDRIDLNEVYEYLVKAGFTSTITCKRNDTNVEALRLLILVAMSSPDVLAQYNPT